MYQWVIKNEGEKLFDSLGRVAGKGSSRVQLSVGNFSGKI